jgi:hypothetical protein
VDHKALKNKNMEMAPGKNAYETATTTLFEKVAAKSQQLAIRRVRQLKQRAPGAAACCDTYGMLDIARGFFRWRSVCRNRREKVGPTLVASLGSA